MDDDNKPTFGLGTFPNLANAQAKQAQVDPSGWIPESQGDTFANYGDGLQQMPANGAFQYNQYGGANYATPAQPPVDTSQSGHSQDQRNAMFDSLSGPSANPGPITYTGAGSSNYSSYPIAPGFNTGSANSSQQPQSQAQQMQVSQNPNQMTMADFRQQMFGGGGPSVSDQIQQAMQQQAQHANKMQIARRVLQGVGMAVAGGFGGAAGMNAAAQTIQGRNMMRSQNDTARAQAQMDLLRFATDNDPNSFKNRMAVGQAYQTFQNQNADNARAQATLDETSRHNKAGEGQTDATNQLAQSQLRYNMSNDAFKNWLETQKFGASQSNDAATRLHQANVDNNALVMQGHTLNQDALSNKRADAQIGYQNQQLKNSDRSYGLQATAQQQGRADKTSELVYDKDGKAHPKYDYSRLNPQVATAPPNDGNIIDAISSFLGIKPAQASQPRTPQPVDPGLQAELKRRGLI